MSNAPIVRIRSHPRITLRLTSILNGLTGPQGSPGTNGTNGTNGAPGETGPPGTDALWNVLGAEYGEGTSYAVGDIVNYNGSTWYRIHANGGTVGNTPAEGAWWTIVAEKGDQGETGPPAPEVVNLSVMAMISPEDFGGSIDPGVSLDLDPETFIIPAGKLVLVWSGVAGDAENGVYESDGLGTYLYSANQILTIENVGELVVVAADLSFAEATAESSAYIISTNDGMLFGLTPVAGSAFKSSLGLGDSALLDIGTGAGTVAAGDDSRLVTISGDAPIVVTAGAVSIDAATTSLPGSMSSADKTKLDGIASGATANAGTVTGVTGTAPISSSGGAAPDISIAAATTSAAGSMSATDKAKLDDYTPLAGSGQSVIVSQTVSGTIAETLPVTAVLTNVSGPTTGVLFLAGVWLAKNTVCTSISWHTGTTGFTSPTNQWFVLCNSSRVSLANTSNDLTTAWGGSTTKTLALTAPFTTTYTGLHYIGFCVTATTMGSYRGLSTSTATPVKQQHFASTSGLTTPPALGTTFAGWLIKENAILGGIL